MVKLVRSCCVFVSLLLVAVCANALVPVQPAGRLYVAPGTNGAVTARGATASEACAALGVAYNTWAKSQGYSSGGAVFVAPTACGVTLNGGQPQSYTQGEAVPSSCPANSTAVTGGCQCNANYDESGGQCVPHVNACTATQGKVGVTNWTQGFSRTPDEGDVQAVGPVNRPPTDGVICDAGCSVSIQMAGPGVNYYVSQSPTASGLYRRSVDYPNIGLGTECTPQAKDAAAQKTTAAPVCPGTVGEVNGKTTCVGTPSKPVPTTPGDEPPVTPVAGNPAAGAKPASGEGSGVGSTGRTPAAGDGGNAGGPAAAGVGGKGGGAGGTAAGSGSGSGGGTTPDDKGEPCGGPGQPICNVKVDEKGTPTGAGETFKPAKDKLDETKQKNDEQLQKASGTQDKGFFEPVRSMFWAPPVAACESFSLPQQVGGLSLDACGVVDGVRNAMAIVWAGAGLFLCFGMIKRSF